MDTRITDDIDLAASLLRAGGRVAFPTETVYGLGADATNEAAVARIFEAKGRPADNPLIVHLADPGDVEAIVRDVPELARLLISAFFPGPLTLILPRRDTIAPNVSAGLDTVAVRVPALPMARDFIRACGVPVAAPSANRSGRPSPTTWEAVADDLDGRIEAILRGPQAEAGLESTVVDCTSEHPVVLRPGTVSLEALQAVVPSVLLPSDPGTLVTRSPGTRHRHYAPQARVVLDDRRPLEAPIAWIGLTSPPEGLPVSFMQGCVSPESYAYELYHFFRRCDAVGVRTIVCETVEDIGIGRALNDRLRRAAAGSAPEASAARAADEPRGEPWNG